MQDSDPASESPGRCAGVEEGPRLPSADTARREARLPPPTPNPGLRVAGVVPVTGLRPGLDQPDPARPGPAAAAARTAAT